MFMPLNSQFCLFSFSVAGLVRKVVDLRDIISVTVLSALFGFYSFQVSGLTFTGHCTYGHSRLRLIESIL